MIRMKKVFLIGWWVDASNYTDFSEYVSQIEWNPYEEKIPWWKDTLSTDLWEEYEVIHIPMPNPYFAHYEYWEQMFEKAREYFDAENIFVGHSMWAIFLMKYLEKNSLPALSIHLVGVCHGDTPSEKIGSFALTSDGSNIHISHEKLHFYFSKDDEIIPFVECEYFQTLFPKSHFHTFPNRWHFVDQEHFPELVHAVRTFS